VVALLDIGNLLCVRTGDSVAQVCGAEIDVDSLALTVLVSRFHTDHKPICTGHGVIS
jgi:hypothetical protein